MAGLKSFWRVEASRDSGIRFLVEVTAHDFWSDGAENGVEAYVPLSRIRFPQYKVWTAEGLTKIKGLVARRVDERHTQELLNGIKS